MAKHPAAVALGSIKSEKKAAAARVNGRKGGWPKGRPRKPVMTDELARAYAKDAANAHMRGEGRSTWNKADHDIAVSTYCRLWPTD